MLRKFSYSQEISFYSITDLPHAIKIGLLKLILGHIASLPATCPIFSYFLIFRKYEGVD